MPVLKKSEQISQNIKLNGIILNSDIFINLDAYPQLPFST